MPSDEVRAELRTALLRDQKVLGQVFPLLERGLSDHEIMRELGRETPGFVSNNRTFIRAILESKTPSGPAIAKQAVGAVRRIASTPNLSADARAHLQSVLDELAAITTGGATSRHRPAAGSDSSARSRGNLRNQVDAEVRQRVTDLVRRIGAETHVAADDYFRVASGPYALDQVVELVLTQETGRTTSALMKAGRPELTLEQAVLEWAADLPLTSGLVESARSRLKFWGS